MTHRILPVALIVLSLTGVVSAQAPPRRPAPPAAPAAAPPVVTFVSEQNAEETRQRLQELLRQLPPSVGEVLALDPSLLNQADYLAAYPTLVAFIAQFPDVARNPSYYFGQRNFRERNPRQAAMDIFAAIMAGIGGLIAFLAVLFVLTWLVRQIIDYRRWNRLTRTQTEVHTKLLDRLQNNEDLLAYMQTAAGRRFLESAPIALDSSQAPTVAAPVNRILWSVQVGVILFVLGIGFWFVRSRVIEELSQVFDVVGVVAVALGAGFVISAVVSYLLSARLGLMEPVRPPQP